MIAMPLVFAVILPLASTLATFVSLDVNVRFPTSYSFNIASIEYDSPTDKFKEVLSTRGVIASK